MVKRLIEEDSLDTMDMRLSDLFRAAAPFEVDPFRKRRILVRLERERASGGRPARFWLRPAVIAALLISGTATAALGSRYVAHGSGFLGLGASPVVTTEAPAPRHASLSKLAPSRLPPASESAVAALPEPVVTPELVDPSARPVVKSISRVRVDSGEDPSHVVEAIQALRTERDPARAQSLLNDYLKAHPRGVLSGDALALSIEAASAQHDPRAADYARRYLASFPKGKYRELAKRALEKQR